MSDKFNLSERPGWFLELVAKAKIVPDYHLHSLCSGQCNALIFSEYVKNHVKPAGTLWEPFASRHTFATNMAVCRSSGKINYLASGDTALSPAGMLYSDAAEVTSYNQGVRLDGVFFHPPYWGSRPFTQDQRDLSNCQTADQYCEKLAVIVKLACRMLVSTGTVCVVGRSYTYRGGAVNLDWLFSKLFIDQDMQVKEVWSSMPDIAVLLKK